MVGFLRKKKSDKVQLSNETALERKGKIDGASLLDGDGEPTTSSLYDVRTMKRNNKDATHRNSDEENLPHIPNGAYPTPPPHMGGMYPQGPQRQASFPPTGYGHNSGYGNQQPPPHQPYGQPQYGQPQYGQSYGQQPQSYAQQPQYGGYGNQSQYGNNSYGNQYPPPQQEYPKSYGHMPPPIMPVSPKKSFFRIPGYGKK